MKKKVKIVRGSNPTLSEALSVLLVQNGGEELGFNFNTITKKLKIFDYNKTLQEQMYGKSYRVVYIEDLQVTREEKIKKILE